MPVAHYIVTCVYFGAELLHITRSLSVIMDFVRWYMQVDAYLTSRSAPYSLRLRSLYFTSCRYCRSTSLIYDFYLSLVHPLNARFFVLLKSFYHHILCFVFVSLQERFLFRARPEFKKDYCDERGKIMVRGFSKIQLLTHASTCNARVGGT